MISVSKRELLSKKLLLAVTCAMSIQVLYASPAWTDTPTVEQDTQTVAANTDTGGAATAQEQAKKQEELRKQQDNSTSLRSLAQYSIDLGSNEYSIMPMAAANTIAMSEDTTLKSIALGTGASFGTFENSVAIGNGSTVTADNQVSFGTYGELDGNQTWTTRRDIVGVKSINGVEINSDYDGAIAIANRSANGAGSISIGKYADADMDNSIAIGKRSYSMDYNTVAIGADSYVTGNNSIGIGVGTKTQYENSVAIGANSNTTKTGQVSFGKYDTDTSTWSERRSLVGISSIYMDGSLSGVTDINGLTISSTKATIGGYSLEEMSQNITLLQNGGVGGGAASAEDITLKSVSLGLGASFGTFKNSVAIGEGSTVTADNQVSFGTYDSVKDNWTATRDLVGVKSINGIGIASSYDGTIMIGSYTSSADINAISIGTNAGAQSEGSIAIGGDAFSDLENTVALGARAKAIEKNSLALGADTIVEHENSVAIGSGSTTTNSNQVSFGTYNVDTQTWTLKRDIVGVASLNEVAIEGNATNKSFGIGNGATFGTFKNSVAIGEGSTVTADNQVSFGFYDSVKGYWTTTSDLVGVKSVNGVAMNSLYDGAIGIGNSTSVIDINAIAIGTNAGAQSEGSIAIGAYAFSDYENDIAIGARANAIGSNSLALGADSRVKLGHENSVAIGSGSTTTDSNQVSFGTYNIDTQTWTATRDIVGVGSINGVDIKVLNDTVGDATSGLVKDVVTNTTDIGSLKTAVGDASSGLVKDVADSKTAIATHTTDIGSLKTAIGDATSGLIKDVATNATDIGTLQTTMAGKANSADVYTKTVADSTFAAKSTVDTINTKTTAMTYTADTTTTTFAGAVQLGSLTVGSGSYGIAADGALTAKSVNGLTISSSKTIVGNYSLEDMQQAIDDLQGGGGGATENTVGIGRSGSGTVVDPYTTTIEGHTKINSDGLTTKALTASGTITANELVENGNKLADKYAAKSTVDTLATTVGSSNSGLVKDVADSKTTIATNTTDIGTLKTAIGDASSGLVKDVADSKTAIATHTTDIGSIKTALGDASSGLVKNVNDLKDSKANAADVYTKTVADSTFAKSVDLTSLGTKVTGNTTDIGLLKTVTSGMNYASNMTTFVGGLTASSLTAGSLSISGSSTIGGVTIAGGNVDGVDVSALKSAVDNISGGGGVATDNTKGISRSGDGSSGSPYTTKIEANTTISSTGISTNALTASGSIAAAEFSEGGTKLSAKYAAKGTVDTLVTTVGNSGSGLVKSVNDLQTSKANVADVYTKTDANSTFAKSVALNALDGKVTTNTTDIGLLKTAATGMNYSSNMTSFAGGLSATALKIGSYGIASDGALTAKSVNGVVINSTNTTIGNYSLKSMYDDIRSLQNSGGGGGTGGGGTNTMGISREGVDADGDGKTTIETNTSIDKNGLTTKQLAAASAQIGGVNFAAGGALTGIASINGIAFGNGTIGGVTLSGGKVNGVDVGALQSSVDKLGSRVTKLENSGGGGGGGTGGGGGNNTAGIARPDSGKGETIIENNTTISNDGILTNQIDVGDKIVVAEGKDNQVTISKDGIHVGKNSSVVNDTDGFITDKGLYIGVDSSNKIDTAKFSVAPNGDLASKAGGYTFSNTASGGAVFGSSSSKYNTAFVAGGATDTTIKGNTITTGSVSTDKLIVNGTEVTVANGTIGNDAVDNKLTTSDGGKDYSNRFTTSAMDGTTQSSSMKNGDTTVGFDVNTKYDGMTLTGSKTVTDKDGNATRTETGSTKMTGDSITVSKDTVHKVKGADGKETEKTTTNSTTIGSGEITLNRENEDGSRETIEVGSAISGLQSDVRSLDSKVSKMGVEIKEVGALSAALAGLHPMPEDANTRTSLAMAMGSYESKQALAVGGFYRPNKRTLLSLSGSFTTSKQMFNMGVSFALDKMPETKKSPSMQSEDKETLQAVLARLEEYQRKLNKLEADNKKLAEDYAELKRQQLAK